jgi:hypothetical protein
MQDRRKDDDKITEILMTLSSMSTKVDQVHGSWFGKNGDGGYKTKIDKMDGGMAVWKFIAGSGGGIGIIALLITIYKLVIGG